MKHRYTMIVEITSEEPIPQNDLEGILISASQDPYAFDIEVTSFRENYTEEYICSLNDATIRMNGRLFRCDCGVNVFKDLGNERYSCNGCRTIWKAEAEEL